MLECAINVKNYIEHSKITRSIHAKAFFGNTLHQQRVFEYEGEFF
jgi:hypothetical protein